MKRYDRNGDKNPRWKGGTSGGYIRKIGLQQLHKHGIYKCQICGSSEQLEVHHKDRNRLNNSIDNLMLVCKSCHRKIHYKEYIPPAVLQGLAHGRSQMIFNRDKRAYKMLELLSERPRTTQELATLLGVHPDVIYEYHKLLKNKIRVKTIVEKRDERGHILRVKKIWCMKQKEE